MHRSKQNRRRLFGTDGIRGTANLELTPELALRIGYAAVKVLARDNPRPLLLVGRDTRISGGMLEAALVAGICSAGGRVELLGVVPTPAVAFLTVKKGADAGVVISASHNPAEDNGIKFFHASGFKLPDMVEDDIERLAADGEVAERPGGDAVGSPMHYRQAEDEYLEHLLEVARPDLGGKRVVLDCANGAVYRLAPRLLDGLGAEVIALHASPDGLNINRGCGSTHVDCLRRAVVEEKADLGLAFDGDADRVLAVDERGQLLDGDFIMAVCALHMRRKGTLAGGALVATVMSNLGFHLAMRREGIGVHVTGVGDRYVLEKMMEEGLNLGGEQSGHVVFLDHATTGDGLVTALKLLEAVEASGGPLSGLAGVMERIPQVLVNVKVREKDRLGESRRVAQALEEWEKRLGDEGRVLLRPSGTEPVVRVMVEDVDPDRAERVARELAALVEREMG